MELEPYVFSNHALQEMTRRNIGREVVAEILDKPEQILQGKEERTIYQSRVNYGEGRVYLIRVIVDVNRDPSLVITVYQTSKI